MLNIRSVLKSILPKSVLVAREARAHKRQLAAKALRVHQIRNANERLLSLSQAGQDLWVYGHVFNERRGGFFVDLGAHDGVYLSNTFLLESRYGWNGILVEANPDTYERLRANRNSSCVQACISSQEETVAFFKNSVLGGIVASDCDPEPSDDVASVVALKTVTLESILDNEAVPQTIDYLSIDIEGAEDRALLRFPFNRYTFTCITIERPSTALREVLQRNDYLLVAEIPGLDCFYVHSSHRQAYHDNTLAFFETQLCYSRSS